AADPDLARAARSQVEDDGAVAVRTHHGRGIDGDVLVGRDGARETDEAERNRVGRKLPPADLVLLAGVPLRGDESVRLGSVRRRVPSPAFVVERADDAEGADGSDAGGDPLRFGKLCLGEGDLGAKLERGGASLGARAGSGGDGVERRGEDAEVRDVLAKLVEAKEVGKGAGGIGLGEDAGGEDRKSTRLNS